MSGRPVSPRGRVALFVGLVFVGLAYIATFVWLKRNSVDFIERDKDMSAVLAAAKIELSTFAWTFEKESPALAMLGGGWQLPGAEGIWSKPRGGVFYLPASVEAGSALDVRFDGHLNASDQEMRVVLLANGNTMGDWRLTHQLWQIVAPVTLPSRVNDAVPWRLQFVIERPSRPLWRGYEPGLLAYGIHLRSLRTADNMASNQQPID